MANPGANARLVPFALILLTALALGVRMLGLDFGLPHMKEKDAEIVSQTSHYRGMELLGKAVKTTYGTYPTLIAMITVATSRRMALPGEGAALEEHLHAAADDHLDTRRTVAWLSALIVPATWLLARRFVGPRWALLAAGLAGASLLHVFFSQQARPHAPLGAFMPLAMAAILWTRRRPTARAYLVVGLLLAVLLGFLHSAIAMFIPLVVASLLRERDGRGWLDPKLLIPLAVAAVAIPVFYWPMIDPDLSSVTAGKFDGETTVTMPGHVIDFRRFNGNGLGTTLVTLRSYEPMLTVLALAAGLVWAIARLRRWDVPRLAERADAAVVLSFCIPYGVVISLWEENYERFVIPLLPFLAVFVAWGARALVHRARSAGARGAVVAAALLLSAFPAYTSARLAWIRSRPDTAEQAAAWLAANTTPGEAKIFAPVWWDLPLPRTEESLHHREEGARPFLKLSYWKYYQVRVAEVPMPPPLWPIYNMIATGSFSADKSIEGLRAYLDYLGPGYYVIDAKKRGHPWMRMMSDELGARGELLQRISPDRDVWKWNYSLFDQDGVEPDYPDLTPRVLGATAVGPVVEIYRVE